MSKRVLISMLGLLSIGLVAAEKPEYITGKFRRVSGDWKLSKTRLEGTSGRQKVRAIVEYPVDVTGDYVLTFEFERVEGRDTIAAILPVGHTQCVLEISGWNGAAHGLAKVNGHHIMDPKNPTSVKPGTIKNKHRYKVAVAVRTQQGNAEIKAYLSGKQFVRFQGKTSQLRPGVANRLPRMNRLGFAIGMNTTVVFGKVRLRSKKEPMKVASRPEVAPLVPKAKPRRHDGKVEALDASRPTVKARPDKAEFTPQIDLGNLDSITLNGKTTIDLAKTSFNPIKGETSIHDLGGTNVLHLKGSDSVAFLPGLIMGDGVIECDISSGTFSGLAFHGVDERNFECVYVRPFNSGSSKHNNTVKYTSHGVSGGDRKSLRARYPGKFEGGADVQPNQWFHLKIIVQRGALSVYVNNDASPALKVSKMLGGRAKGRIGVWGWDTYFCNFSITPATR